MMKDILKDFDVVRKIGSGSYSTVFAAVHKGTGKNFAIKREANIFADLVDCKRVLREIRILRALKHPNVVRLLEIRASKDLVPDTIYLILELAETDLKQVIKTPDLSLQDWQIKVTLYDILKGLKYIHSATVLHRDIKPGNILIGGDSRIIICDFGLSRSVANCKGSSAFLKKLKASERSGKDKIEGIKAVQSNGERIVQLECEKLSLSDGPKPLQSLSSSSPSASGIEEEKKADSKVLALPQMIRGLSSYVVTRWYRAPEIILSQADYGPGIDIWATGCIFAELLSRLKSNQVDFRGFPVLFPGSSCYPFSPDKAGAIRGDISSLPTDQLNVILSVIGTPTVEDCMFITNPETRRVILEMPQIARQDLSVVYTAAGRDAIDLLDKMLVFNPFKRITVDQCLEHPFLADVRDVKSEIAATEKVMLSFEDGPELTKERLTELFMEDVAYFDDLRTKGEINYG